jgi:hypothetical protein
MIYLMVVLIILSFSNGLFAKETRRAKIENPTQCSVRINGAVNWRGEDRNSIATIKSNFVISGTMKMKWQGKGGYANRFEVDRMQVSYSHLAQIYKKKPDRDCPELLRFEVKASGSLPITNGSLSIRYEEKVPAGHPIKQSMLQFSFNPGHLKGKMKTLDRCKYTTRELDLVIAYVNVIDTSKIARDQTSFSGSRSFGIPPDTTNIEGLSVFMPFVFSDKVLSRGPSSLPNEIESILSSVGDKLVEFNGFSTGGKVGMPPGNDAQLTWKIKIGPSVEIWKDDKDITDQVQDVVVGERIKLKAVVYPEDKSPKQGEWSIGSITPKSGGTYKEKKFLKDFLVSGEEGKVIELKGEELKEPEIKFHWWDEGKNIKIKYKTVVDGKEVTGESTFNVRKPVITMSAETPQGSSYCGPIEGARDNVFYETPGKTTIKFTRTEIPEDFPGETQYVQVVHEVGCMLKGQTALPFTTIKNKKEIRSFCGEVDHTGLDTEYPYTKEREALDTPGFDFGTRDQEMSVRRKFKMYLEYKPKKEGAIFVPLRVTDWDWKGVAKWDSPQAETPSCHVTRTENPRDKPAKEYATWTQVLKPREDKDGRITDKWDPCIPEKTECR